MSDVKAHTKIITKLPELLSPAGSRAALDAAIEGGADAVYIGGTSFNARINAKNFSGDDLRESVRLAHAYGVKVYQTLNTAVLDRELDEFLRAAERSLESKIDAFIVADLGAAKLLRKYFPEATLHASTQMSVHNSDGGRALEKYGFSRLVPAREMSLENIKSMVENNPLEVEIFVHGALCVCHSGQCLFSSLVGGRSGNRGLCAQPCRLPYHTERGDKYPLSLKDLSLCEHIPEIIDSGVHSLKIEGRMKSPEYVYLVTRVWRRLLDERRGATKREIAEMAEAFSRGGFTDGYFVGSIDKKMLGVRSESDKQSSREIERFDGIKRKIPVDMNLYAVCGEPIRLSVSCGEREAAVTGDIAQRAINAPTDAETIKRSLQKLGNTCYMLRELDVVCDNIMIPISRLNDLRRRAIEALEADNGTHNEHKMPEKFELDTPKGKRELGRSARFLDPSQITNAARKYFDKIYLPLDKLCDKADGFIMPPVIFDSEKSEIKSLIEKAISLGAKSALVTNIGQIELLAKYEIDLVGDYRLNVMNSETVSRLEDMGIFETLCSPELTLPQLRDIKGKTSAVIYGRIPLMTLEKCVIRDLWGCEKCQKNKPGEYTVLKDRRGYEFPILREGKSHRNIIYNSLPTNMSDRQGELDRARVTSRHFIFTVETADEVDMIIEDYKKERTPTGGVRRV